MQVLSTTQKGGSLSHLERIPLLLQTGFRLVTAM